MKDPAPDDAKRRAADLLASSAGLLRTLEVEATPQPWLQPGDVVEVKIGSASEKVRVDGWRLTAGSTLSFGLRVSAANVTKPQLAPLAHPGADLVLGGVR